MDKIKFAVVGCGHIGKRHAKVIQENAEAELVALCDILSMDKVGAEVFNVPYFNTIDDLLQSNIAFDVVNIATPNGLHEAHAVAALGAGRHIVLEKPMALSKVSGERIISKALQQDRQVFCVMQNRYSPPSVWLKNILQDNTLGKIFMVQINCYWNRDDRYYKKEGWHGNIDLDGGTLFTQFSHFIDLMYWCFGDIENINARFRDFSHADSTDFEDSGIVNFDFRNGGIGTLNYSTAIWDKNLESSITIIAENGSIKIGGQYMNEVEYCHIKNYTMPVLAPSNPPNDYGQYKGSAANHHYIIKNVVDVLKNRSAITTNALEGLKVVDIIGRIYQCK